MARADETSRLRLNGATQMRTYQADGNEAVAGVHQKRRNVWQYRPRVQRKCRSGPKVKFGFPARLGFEIEKAKHSAGGKHSAGRKERRGRELQKVAPTGL
jgi:hypothetical protein